MKLTTKDRLTLGVGAVILLVFVVIQFGLLPILDKRERLTRAIERNESAVVRMGEIETQYRQLNQQSNSLSRQIDRRPAGFSLFSFLEKAAVDSEVKEHIVYMKPSAARGDGTLRQIMVEMKLRAIGLKQLVDFIERVEDPEHVVAVKRCSIQENRKSAGTLDVIVQVISMESGQIEQ